MTTTPIRVHQILVGSGPGDAITQMALALHTALSDEFESTVWALWVDPAVGMEVADLRHLPPGRSRDVIVYHSSFGDPAITRLLLQRPERLVVAYHNITPASLFAEFDPGFAVGLEWGRFELGLLRDRTRLAVADSTFSANELDSIGFDDIRTVPAGLEPARLLDVTPSLEVDRSLDDRISSGFVVNVSQLLPHKHQHELIQAVHLLQTVHGIDIGAVLVGAPRSTTYATALQRLVDRLRVRNVWITGRLSDAGVATVYRRAQAFAGTSTHEGLGIPPLEAMAFGVPVVARASGATAETLGDAALLLPERAGPLLFAEAIARMHDDASLRASLIERGHERVVDVMATDPTNQFADLLRDLGAPV